MAEIDVVLNQNDNLGFNVQVKLVDGRELQVIKSRKKNEQRYSIDILALQEKSKKTFVIAWKWLIASVSFFLVMLLLLKFLPQVLGENRNLYLAIILFSGLIGSVLCFIQFWKHTSRKQVFYSCNAHVPVISFNIGKPSKDVFTDFITRLEHRIKKFRQHMSIPMDKQLTGEMKMLRRLTDAGVMSQSEYETAKSKIFSGFDSNFVNRSDQD
jgi:hypothetical protein